MMKQLLQVASEGIFFLMARLYFLHDDKSVLGHMLFGTIVKEKLITEQLYLLIVYSDYFPLPHGRLQACSRSFAQKSKNVFTPWIFNLRLKMENIGLYTVSKAISCMWKDPCCYLPFSNPNPPVRTSFANIVLVELIGCETNHTLYQ